ncbi:peptidoglycan editing factor PgeF [Bacillus cytotoxicus]|uniref:peptidoglycan editing factor PgeF n=1 Tax=Bacillus cereus group sp. BfR-BA-01492 TaxID=2920361 RepID=UPI001F566418|nr:peptidoglycan editing factor PgeF [Bacillus cereus group sp. BfR-BA-01492]EMA6341261.1 peptidoglycan editing factor PgeF [Bacillus cytotoxicus]
MREPFKYVDGILYLQAWEDLGNITAGFTTKDGGVSTGSFHAMNLGLHVNDIIENVHENRRILANKLHKPLENWICSEQVHDHHVEKVGHEEKGRGVYVYEDGIQKTDGIYTADKDVCLTSCYADCVPLFFYAPSHGLIGLAHAGWKGTVKEIANEMIQKWKAEGVSTTDIHVAIGPSIGACCYVVDDRVLSAAKQVINGSVPYKVISDGQYAIDLKEINRIVCLQAGIKEEHIVMSSLCTSCEEQLFFSHRRDQGKTGRMLSFIGFKED